ncbi:OrNVorf59-like [Venturia canescens]|uniref:OrNVorf59-like n=1 Tax=Venturia canescens TaxID=32260 RepID=A0ACB9ZLE8_9HYME|nr:uncharacterized LOC122408855 [Venturia canescens]KAI5630624.1 OrNVorf59-like [Venturia canescens]
MAPASLPTKTILKSVNVPIKRNKHSIDIAQTAIPLSSGATVNVCFHKHMCGHIMIELNDRNEPTKAWRDVAGVFPIRSKLINPEQFREKLAACRPRILYLNDAVLLSPLDKSWNTRVVRHTCGLYELLTSIKRKQKKKNSQSNSSNGETPISYRKAKALDPTMNFREYQQIFC